MEMARNPRYKDQFSPYNVLGCNVTKPYNGTLFRFPLRRRPSELSPNVCTTDRIRDLFQSFQVDAHLVLLFLKAVEAITIYEWLPGKSKPTEVFKVQLSEATRETVRAERERLLSDISSARSLEGHFKAGEELARFYHVEITCTKRGQDPVTQCWLVHNFISSKHEKVNSTATEHHQIPWVGLAVPIDPMTEHADGLGRIFCFLPLPPSEDADSNTGLPVHVHGSFSVADNRRSLKWPAEDRQKDEKAFWNQLLTEQLLTQAYVGLILYTIQLQCTGTSLTPEVVYRMWPYPRHVRHHWAKYLLPRLLRGLSQHAVLWTEALEGKWVQIQEAIVNETQESDLSPHETVAVDEMLRIGYPVVLPPPAVTRCLDEIADEFEVATIRMSPEIVRTRLKKSDRYQQMHSNDKVQLLKYVIQDECYSALDSLRLLPLSTGEFTSFEASCLSIYIATAQCPQSLFPGLEGRFLDEKIDTSVYNSLKASGCRRLSVLVSDIVPALVRCVLPSQWATIQNSTVSQPKQMGGVSTKKWLTELWKWINKNLGVVSVSNFAGIHIVPVTSTDGSKKLMKLDVEQPLIFAQLPGTSIKIQRDLASGLEAVGCTVLLDAPQYLCSCHQLHGTYVCRPTEIVTCIARVPATPDYNVLTNSQRKQIVPLLSAALQVNPPSNTTEKNVLARLPVIRQYGSDDLISVAECPEVAPTSRELPEHLPIRVRLLASPSKEEETVMDKSSVRYRRLTVEDIYSQKVIPQFRQYRDEEKEQLMVYLLENIHLISNPKSDILRRLSELEFVKTKDLMLKAPQKLFSPTEKYAEQLFSGLPVFPIGIFDVNKKHGQLLCSHVGLRKLKDLSSEELQQILHHVAANGTQERGNALLDLFVQCKWAQQLLPQKSLFNAGRTALSRVAWVPVINKPPQNYPSNLHWEGCSSLCVPSSVVGATKDLPIDTLQLVLGSQLCIVDYFTPFPETLIALLGLAGKETIFGAVVRHLRSVHDIWTKEIPKDTEKSKLDTVLYKIILLLAEGFQSSSEVREAIKRELRNFDATDWVWLGVSQGFARPDQLVVSSTCPVSLEPWLFKVEEYRHLSSCTNLLKEYGLKDTIRKEDALLVLAHMQSSSSGVQGKEQQKRNLNLAIEILNWITSDPTTLSDSLKAMVLVPVDSKDNRLELAPLSELKYCDAKWLDKIQDSELEGYKLIHKKISKKTASKLGVPSISSRLARSVSLDFEFEQLGQHEPLTRRLKNILKDYKDDAGIFKEIVQNADDAGATKVRFLVDWRKHPTTSLLSPGMKRCQGPALWAYNDSVFRDEDFQNIAKLAAATKLANLDKIGRFGLGFTSVYHITDVPSFVSRRFVVVFDPHTTHLGDHIQNPSKPGVKIDFIGQPVAKLFQDQFCPYKGVFGCNLESDREFPGTLFRFPFRTLEQAGTSEIKDEFYGEKRVRASIAALKYACPKLLLFLNNVKSVELFELEANSKDASEMKLLLSVQSETTMFPQTKPCTDILSACCEEVRQQRPFPSTNCRESTALSQISVSTLEGKKMERCKETWLINARTGDGEALEYACSKDGEELGLVPFAGVAVKLDCVGRKRNPLEERKGLPATVDGEAFCFLPLSESTGLPFHINGFFSVNSYRRGIWWFGTKETSVKGVDDRDPVWNKKLIEDPLVKSCLGLLKCFATVLNTSDPKAGLAYYKLWPSVNGTSEACWRHFAQQFYSAVANCEENVVCTSGSHVAWSSLRGCLMLRKSVAKRHPDAHRVMKEFCNAYVEFPDHVVEGLRAADDSLVDDISVSEVQFVENYFAPNVTSLQSSVRDGITVTVMKRSLEDRILAASVRNLSLIPCSPNGLQFKMASELVDPSCPEARLYLDEECKFPAEGVYRNDDVLFAMKGLGMRSIGCFTWHDVIERAGTVEELEKRNPGHAVHRMSALVDLIEQLTKRTGQPSADEVNELRKLRFLPVANRPKSYPLPVWHAATVGRATVACPEDLYNPRCTNTVGSQALILDSTLQLSVPVAELLGVKSRPDLSLLLEHLTLAIDTWRGSSNQAKSLNSLILEVYSEMEERIADPTSRDIVVSTLKDKEWIKIGSHTVKSQQLAFDWDKEAAPYLIKVPYDLKQSIGHLLQAVGVRNKFTCDDFVWALKRLYSDTAEDGNRLANRPMRTARLLLEELQNVDERELAKYKGTIPVLSEEKTLFPASALAYNDAPWIVLPNEEQHKFVHKYISRFLAQHLGVKLVRSKVLERYAEEWPGEPFGQHEPLTQRLKNILEGYPVGDAILKELLQNADDARASELHFIYDKRDHATERVLSEKWSELQGKALCVYNDRPFSQADIRGIQNLGRGSKRDDPALTGQYGIGFNAVYHLTDCPSFITNNERLCVMDPHCQYAEGATIQSPGRLYRIDKSFWDRCPDVRPCYCEIPGVTLEGGTLFRFPLRTRDMASRSQISNSAWGGSRMEVLFEEFKDGAADMLLFLNHVSSIKLSVVEKDGSIKSSFSVSSAMSEEAREKRRSLADHIASNKHRPTDSIEYRHVTYELTTTKEEPTQVVSSISQAWLVHQSFGLSPECKEAGFPDVSRLSLLPRAGIAAVIRPKSDVDSCSKAFCFLPLPVATHLPVHVNGHFALNDSRRNLWQEQTKFRTSEKQQWNEKLIERIVAPAYAKFLLEARTYVELAVTSTSETALVCQQLEDSLGWFYGLFPRLTESRDHYWDMLAREVYRHIVECRLPLLVLTDQPLPSELQSIEGYVSSRKRSKPIDECRGWFIKAPSIQWLPVATKKETVPALFCAYFWNMKETCSLMDVATSLTTDGNLRAYILKCLLLLLGFPVVASPLSVRESFEMIDRKDATATVSPEAVALFLANHMNLQLGCKLRLGDVQKTVLRSAAYVSIVLQYLLTPTGIDVTQLKGIPLLVDQNGQLKQFSEQYPVYVSRYCKLLPNNSEMFLHEELISIIITLRSNWYQAKIFKELTPQCLTSHLPSSDVFPCDMPTVTTYLQWNEEQGPSVDWITTLWRYLDSLEGNKNDALDHLSRWPVIPLHQRQYLVPPQLGHSVFCFEFVGSPLAAVEAVLKLMKVPELNVQLTCGLHASELHPRLISLVADLQRPDCVASALCYMYENRPPSTPVRNEDAETLLKYFQTSVQYIGGMARVVPNGCLMKQLPLFECLDGSLTDIASCYEYHTLPPEVPANGAKVWMNKAKNVMFFKKKIMLTDLYDALGLDNLTPSKVYVDFILDSLPDMTPEDRVAHLLFIRQNHEYWKGEKEIIDPVMFKLKRIRCLPGREEKSGEEILLPVSSFFDWEVDVFRLFLKPARFPPETLRDYWWHRFFVELGLQTIATSDQLIYFAQTLERESVGCLRDERQEFEEKSKAIVDHLFSHYSRDKQLLRQIANIAFIPARICQKTLVKLARPHADRMLSACTSGWVMSFTDSVRYSRDNEMLCWTVAGLLPPWTKQYLHQHHQDIERERILQVKTEPSVSNVLENLICVVEDCQQVIYPNQQADKELTSTLVRVLAVIFEHLQKKCCPALKIPTKHQVFKNLRRLSNLCTADSSDAHAVVEKLHSYPCIFIEDGNEFVKPCQVVSNLSIENSSLAPYLCRLPGYLAPARDILKRIGVEEQPQAFHYARVLEQLRDNSNANEGGNRKLLPGKERSGAMTAIELLFKELKRICLRTSYPKSSTKQHPYSEEELQACLDPLFLLSRQNAMEASGELLFLDRPEYNKCVSFLEKPFLLPLRDFNLSPLAQETVNLLPQSLRPRHLSELATETLVTEVEQDESISVRSKDMEEYAQELQSLVSSDEFVSGIYSTIVHYQKTSSFSKKVAYALNSLQSVEFRCLPNVSTRLILKDPPGRIVPESERSVTCFMEERDEGDGPIKLYVSFSDGSRTIEMVSDLSIIFRRLLEIDLPGEIVVSLLGCRSPSDIQECLARKSIDFTHYHRELIHATDIFRLGATVDYQYEDDGLVINDLNYSFQPGEWVAYEIAEDRKVYAQIDEEVTDETTPKLEKRYRIDIGGEELIVVSALDIYKFDRRLHERRLSTQSAMVPTDDPMRPSINPDASVEEKIRLVRQILDEIWRIRDKDDRRKAVRRLYLRWHPDTSNDPNANEVFQFLRQEVIGRESQETPPSISSSNYHPTAYSSFYSSWDDTVTSRSVRRCRRVTSYSSSSSSWQKPSPTPDPSLGRKFVQQASADFDAASYLMAAGRERFYATICFLCQQTAEKALKGAWYVKTGLSYDRRSSHSIRDFVGLQQLPGVPPLDNAISRLVDLDHETTRYPSSSTEPPAVSAAYSRQRAESCLSAAKDLLEKVQELITI